MPWCALERSLAEDVADSFLAKIGATESAFWKLGAIDQITQARLGLSGPVMAPLDPALVVEDASTFAFELSSLIAPRFEAEIGVSISGGRLLAAGCVEIADSRFRNWDLPPFGVIADASLQGVMLFGPPMAPVAEISVTIKHEDQFRETRQGAWSDAVHRLELLPQNLSPRTVATGAISEMFECNPGTWTFDFGYLGVITVLVS